jgi:hypothetical protein
MRRLVYASREPIIRSGAALTVTLGTRVADHIGGSARGYLANSSRRQRSSHHGHPQHDTERSWIFMQTVVSAGNVRNCRE